MIVQHNLASMNADRNLKVSTGSIGKSTEKLSSGFKINRAADDAAGLTISEKMRSQIRGLTQASANTQDGVSFCQIADGALDEVQGMLKRCSELAVKASNGTNTQADRDAMQSEIAEISSEIDRVHESALFNEIRVFPDAGYNPDEFAAALTSAPVKTVTAGNITFTLEFIGTDGKIDTEPAENIKATGSANPDSVANSEMAAFVVSAAAKAVNNLSSKYPNLFNEASTQNINIGLEMSPQGKGGTLATAYMSVSSNSSSTVTSYKMWVDTADYPVESFPSMSDAQKADLAATIAHEMTHLVMDDTLTSGMIGSFPKWFKEGMAQTSSGDNGWMGYELDGTSTDTDIKNYKSQLTTDPYGAGYAASMYLGWLANKQAGGSDAVNSTNIANGLDRLLTEVAKNIKADGSGSNTILDKAISTVTGGKYTSTAAFESAFSSAADTDSLSFMKNFITARGNGAGSIFGELNAAEASVFAPSTISGASTSHYKVNKDNQWYSNAFGTGFTFPEKLPSRGNSGGVGNDKNGFIIQAGAANKQEQQIFVKQYNITMESLLDGRELDVSTMEGARASIALAQKADAKISAVRSYYGAMQNRFEHTISNLDNVVENTTAAESLIRDTDMAAEMVNHTKLNVLIQAGNAMLSQAMQQPQSVLQLLS